MEQKHPLSTVVSGQADRDNCFSAGSYLFSLSYGLNITVKESSLDNRRRAVKLLLKSSDSIGKPKFLASPKCINFIESIKNQQRSKTNEDKARRDSNCHSVTSFEYFCISEFPPVMASAVI